MGIVLIIGSLVLIVLILYKRSQMKIVISSIRLSSYVLKKRKLAFFLPIFFIIIQTSNLILVGYFIIGVIMAGTLDIRMGFYLLNSLDESFQLHS